ncbi:MAG: PKD domain-containing protein [Bacteroidota bacterium]
MKKRRNTFAALLLFLTGIAFGQDETLTNTGIPMIIQEGVTLFVDGDYEDKDIDEGIILEGTFEITGDLYDRSDRGTLFNPNTVNKLIFADDTVEINVNLDNAKVVLSGADAQQIQSDSLAFFPALEIKKPTSDKEVILKGDVSVRNELTLDTGRINLNGNSITLSSQLRGLLLKENADNYVFGDGFIRKSSLVYNTDSTKTNGESFNVGGLGLSLATADAAAGVTIGITRWHEAITNVADGSVALYYEVSSDNKGQLIDSVSIASNVDVPTGPAQAIYYSQDTTIWTPYDASVTGNTNAFQTTKIIPEDTLIIIGEDNYFTIAARNCVITNNQPNFNITDTITIAMDNGSPRNGNRNDPMDFTRDTINGKFIDVCDLSDLTLEASEPFPFYQWESHSTISSTDLDAKSINIMGVNETVTYSLMVRNDRGCETRDTLEVRAHDNPVAQFPNPYDTLRVCTDFTLEFNSESSAEDRSIITGYKWDFGNGETIDETNPSNTVTHSYTDSSFYSIRHDVITEFGCRNLEGGAAFQNIPILEPPFIDPIVITGGKEPNEACEAKELVLSSSANFEDIFGTNLDPSLQYTWDFGDGTSATTGGGGSSSVFHEYTLGNKSRFAINLEVEGTGNSDGDSRGCHSTIATDLIIRPKPEPLFEVQVVGTPSAILDVCEGIDLILENQSSISNGDATTDTIASYAWDFGNGKALTTKTNESPVVQYNQEDTLNIQLTTTSNFGCQETTILTNFIVHPQPEGAAGTDIYATNDVNGLPERTSVFCVNDEVSFVNGSTNPGGAPLGYTWDFGDGNTSTDSIPRHVYTKSGSYQVQLTRTSDQGCENTTVPFDVNVRDYPIPSFVFEDQCDGKEFTFFNNSFLPNGSNDVTYQWNFGDGSKSEEKDPKHTYTNVNFGNQNTATFDVTLTVTNVASTADCSASVTETVTVYRNPSFDLPSAIISFDPQVVIDPLDSPKAFIPTNASYLWEEQRTGNTFTSTTYTAMTDGAYSLKVTSDFGCAEEDNVVVFLLETVSLGPDQVLCENTRLDAKISLSPKLQPDTIQWFRNGTVIQVGDTPYIDVLESGTYRVEVTYAAQGVTATTNDEVIITIEDPITLNLAPAYEGCFQQPVTIDAGVTADSYSWKNSAGQEVATARIAQFDIADTYTLTVTKGTCSDAATFDFSVLDSPNAFFTVSANEVCEGDVFTFTTAYDASHTVTWDFGDGTTVTGPNVTHTYGNPGRYEVEVTVTNANGCSASFLRSLVVHPHPTASFTATNGCEGEPITFSNTSTTSAGQITYAWDFGDGTISSDPVPIHVYNVEGTFEVTLVVTNNGCRSEASQSVTIYDLPVLGFGARVTTCGTEVTLSSPATGTHRWYDVNTGVTLNTTSSYTATISRRIGLEYTSENKCTVIEETEVLLNTQIEVALGATGPLTFCEIGELDAGTFPNATYEWSTGDSTQRIDVTESGDYFVTVKDANGCEDSGQVTVIIYDQPQVDLGPDIEVCDTEVPVTLQARTTAEAYLWPATNETTASIQVSTSGKYKVEVSNGNGKCVATDSVNVIVNESPEPSFMTTDVCLGDRTVFQNTTTTGNDYLWDFGDGTTSPVPSPVHTYARAGDYTVRLTATTRGKCSSFVTQRVRIHPVAVPDFVVMDGCVGTEFVFRNTSVYLGDEQNLTYRWDFGDGAIATTRDVAHRYTTPNTYQVSLTVTTPTCSQTIRKQVEVHAAPDLSHIADTIRTCELQVRLDAMNPGSSYRWQDNSTNREFLVRQTGRYTVEVRNTFECTSSASVYVELLEISQPDLGPDTEGCGEVQLSANTDAVSYRWSTDATTPDITVTTSGTYAVETVSGALCLVTDTIEVIVHDLPIFDLGPDQQTCEGDAITLQAGAGDTFRWSTGETTPSITVTTSGTVKATAVTNEGCDYTDEVSLTFYDLPEKPFTDTYEACDNLELDAGPSENTYLWSTGSTEKTEVIEESGFFWVKVSSPENCTTFDTTFVAIFSSPVVELDDQVETCFGEPVTLDAGGQNLNHTIRWNTGETTQTIEAGASGMYWVDVTNGDGCTVRDSVEVIERKPLNIALGDDFIFCESVELDAGRDNVAYNWTLPDGSKQSTRKVFAELEGTYSLEVTDGFGCTATDAITLTQTTEKVKAHFLAPSIVLAGNRVVFQALSEQDILSYRWDFGDGSFNDKNNPSPIYRYIVPGTYQATLTYSNGICTETLTKEIEVLPRGRGRQEADEPAGTGRALFVEILEHEVYPNPVKDFMTFSIRLNQPAPVQLKIHDLTGETYFRLTHEVEDDQLGLDFSNYQPGIYLMSVKVGKQFITQKIMKIDE